MDCSLPGSLCPWDSPGKNTEVGPHALLLASIVLSIRIFSNEPALHMRYWSFSFILSSGRVEYSGLISFRIDGSLCNPRNSQKPSPAPQFKSINSLELSLLYSSTLISVHGYSYDYMDLCQQSDVSSL